MTATVERGSSTAVDVSAVPRLVDGVEFLGRYDGSGYQDPRFLIARPDGQVIQVSEGLYRVAEAIDSRRTVAEIAARVAAALDREVDAAAVVELVQTRLAPAGLIAGSDVAPAEQRPDHLMMLRHRAPLIPPRVSWVIAGIFRPMHRPPVVIIFLSAFVLVDLLIVLGGGLADIEPGALALVQTPALSLAVLGLVLLAGVIHECGHVSACRYGGARPGPMGVGLYIVWPAFYSTVTDSYRLSRGGRLRTDLGGVYFNATVIMITGSAYLATGAQWLLPAILALHAETARQFLPSIRLDGYYILADLIGLPDLFSFLGPVLRGVLPRGRKDPRVLGLRPVVRRVIVTWVLLVVPFLAFFLISFLVLAPEVLPAMVTSVGEEVTAAGAAVRTGDAASAVLAVLQGALVLLPVFGGLLILGSVLRQVAAPLLPPQVADPGKPDRRLFAVVAVAVGVLGLLALAALDLRSAGPAEALAAAGAGAGSDAVAFQQFAAVRALLGGLAGSQVLDAVRAVSVLLGVATALLVWPVARRLGRPAGLSGAAAVLCAAGGLLTGLYGTVDPGVVAAFWLAGAAALAGRGRGGTGAAAVAVALAVVSAPVAAAGVAAFAAHAALTGQLAGTLPRPGRWVFAGLAAAAAVAAVVAAPGGGAGPLAPGLAVGLAVVGAVLCALAWWRLPGLRPVATGAAVLLLVVAVPGARSTAAALIALPVLALLGGALLAVLTRDRRPGAVLALVLVGAAACATPLVGAAAAVGPAPGALAGWIDAQLDPAVAVQVDPLTVAQLRADGVPAERLRDPAPGGAAVTVGPIGGPGRTLLVLPDGPAHTPVAVHLIAPGTAGPNPVAPGTAGPDPAAPSAGPNLPRLGAELADNPGLAAPDPVRADLRAERVDQRLAAVLTGLTATHRIRVALLPTVPGEPAGVVLRTAVIDEVDAQPTTTPGASTLVERWLDAQQPPFRPVSVSVQDGRLVVRYPAPSPS